MADTLTQAQRSARMSSVRHESTSLEVLVRKGLHRRGLRYRIGGKGLAGSPDLVFPALKAVVFVHGCFWHAHECKLGKRPSSNVKFWAQKASANRARDARKEAELEALGWRVFVIWQCQFQALVSREGCLDRLASALRATPSCA